MATQENLVKKRVREYLMEIGAYTFMPVQMGMGAATLDFLCCYKGRFIAIETKATGKKATKRQELIALAMQEAGAVTILAYGVEDVQQALVAAGLR